MYLAFENFTSGLALDKSDNKPAQNEKIVGKWYADKLIIAEQNINSGALVDKVFTGDDFTSNDYFQFNNNDTASISASGDFYIFGKCLMMDGRGETVNSINNFNYTSTDSTLILSPINADLLPTGSEPCLLTRTLLLLNKNILILRNVEIDNLYKTTTDTYYTKGS